MNDIKKLIGDLNTFEERGANLSEGAVPNKLSNSIIGKLDSEVIYIQKGLTLTNIPIVNISPQETKIELSQNLNNKKDE